MDSEKEAVLDIITRKDNLLKEEEEEEGKDKVVPNKQRDDLARRRAQSTTLSYRDGSKSFVSSSMSLADMQKWERLKMTEPRCSTHTFILIKHVINAVKCCCTGTSADARVCSFNAKVTGEILRKSLLSERSG